MILYCIWFEYFGLLGYRLYAYPLGLITNARTPDARGESLSARV